MCPVVAPTQIAQQIVCNKHPETAAAWLCGKCGKAFCEPCMSAGATNRLAKECCPSCRGFCRHLVQSGPLRPSSFGEIVGGAFIYPLRGTGIFLLLLGVIFFALLKLLSLSPFYGAAFMLIGSGYFAAYVFKVLNSSSRGDRDLPDWPEFTDFYDSILLPFLQFSFTSLVCYAPAVLALLGLGLDLPGIASCVTLGLLGSLYYPMALLSVALNGSVMGTRPGIVVPGIGAVTGPYLAICAILSLTFGLSWFFLAVIDAFVPYVGAALSGFVSLYLVTVQMRLLGMLYFTYEDRFPWFK
jgi:hypothetical protein